MTATILIFVALAFGIALGWFLGGRPVNDWRSRHGERESECKALNEKLSRMAPELATMSERAARADALAASLDAVREEL
ncbi:MAG: DNA recombination protein RmuC, partial [Tsuneonella sp.]